jgi:hypothetical protein
LNAQEFLAIPGVRDGCDLSSSSCQAEGSPYGTLVVQPGAVRPDRTTSNDTDDGAITPRDAFDVTIVADQFISRATSMKDFVVQRFWTAVSFCFAPVA